MALPGNGREGEAPLDLDGDEAIEAEEQLTLASSFVAALELARLGKAEIRQEEAFGPMHLRRVPA